MYRESILQIRRRIIILNINEADHIQCWEALMKEQLALYTLLKDNPKINRLEGIKPTVFGHMIMQDEYKEYAHKALFFRCTRNEMLRAIDVVLLE